MSTTEQLYECIECGHRIKIYEKEEQAVFCTCDDEGPPMKPVEASAEVNE